MQLYLLASGIKPSGITTQPHPGGDNLPGRNYENLELLNRPVAEDNEQVVCMSNKVAQKQAINHSISFYVTSFWHCFYILGQEVKITMHF